MLYNVKKWVHAIKFQSVVAPNGMIGNCMGQLRESVMIVGDLQRHSFCTNGNPLCMWRPGIPINSISQCSISSERI